MDTNEYPEELKHLGLAALTIASFKQTKFDASTIDELKRKLVRDTRDKHHDKHHKVSHTSKIIIRIPDGSKKANGVSQIEKSPTTELTSIQTNFNPISFEKPAPNSLYWRYKPLANMEEASWRTICNYSPPDIPPIQRLQGLIGRCSKPFEKQLTNSDIKEDQSRLSLNKTDVEECILPLLNEDEDPEKEIRVTTYDQEGSQFEMVYKIWSAKYHVLVKGWKEFFLKHKLRMHEDFVTLWMFRNRDTHKLCFAITWRRLPIFHLLKRKKRNN